MGFGFGDEHGLQFTIGWRIAVHESEKGWVTSASEWCVGVRYVVQLGIGE